MITSGADGEETPKSYTCFLVPFKLVRVSISTPAQ